MRPQIPCTLACSEAPLPAATGRDERRRRRGNEPARAARDVSAAALDYGRMPSLFPSGPREPPEFARPQRLGVLPTMAYWNGTGLGSVFVGFLAAVGAIATRGTLPKPVGLALGVLVGLLILGLVERAHRRRRARPPAPPEAVGPESLWHPTEPTASA